ncbi:MAG: TIGR00269 family protein [Nanoarchaeota archaeon]
MEKLNDAGFKRYFEDKVRTTVRTQRLFSQKDRIAVAASGGKDSTALLFVLHKLGFELEALTIDPGIGSYSRDNLVRLKAFCKKKGIPLHILSYKTEFGKTLPQMLLALKRKGVDRSPCNVCGVLKRHLLNSYARKQGFSVLATGHNLDNESQAFVMNVFRNDLKLALRQGPVSGTAQSGRFVKRVKPLFYMAEKEVIRYAKLQKLPVKYGICPLAGNAYRRKHIRILDKIEKMNPHLKYNIIRFQEGMRRVCETPKESIEECPGCGEASSKGLCKACQILEEIGKMHPKSY